jgi:hypothetical protein
MNTNLLKNLDFASKINQTEAISEAGKEMLAKYRAYIYANPATCGIVNGFVQEAKNFSFDAGLVNILNTVQNYINENKISWKYFTLLLDTYKEVAYAFQIQRSILPLFCAY